MNDLILNQIKSKKLPTSLVERVIDFVQELDAFVTDLQPEKSTRLLDTHLVLFSNPQAPDADGGLDVLKKLMAQYSVNGYTMTRSDARSLITCVILVACHLAAHAIHANTQEEALDFFLDAREMRGFANGLIWTGDDSMVRSELARRGAEVTNSIYKPTKERVFAWCDQNFASKRSLEAAARDIESIEKISLATARKYIKEWKAQKS